jgi:hypothetical protein
VAMVFDVAVALPDSGGTKTDAIQVSLEHVAGYSSEVFFPYQIINGEIVYGKAFAQLGKHEIFSSSAGTEPDREV